eukprot:NODE_110_length_18645_cov_0.794403.p7 type:complete len:357 gc:universal NODE_110_length_18645_cov_0.794403:18575-17505(-)
MMLLNLMKSQKRFITSRSNSKRYASQPSKPQFNLKCTELNDSGKKSNMQSNKLDLCASFGLQPRDLRKVDSRIKTFPSLAVREEAIIISLETIKAVVSNNRMLLFEPQQQSELEKLSQLMFNLETKLADPSDALPYEFKVMEVMLESYVSELQDELRKMSMPVEIILDNFQHKNKISRRDLMSLLQYSKELNSFMQKLEPFSRSLNELLESDEDLTELHLTEKKVHPDKYSRVRVGDNNHTEIELLLENYVSRIEEIMQLTNELQKQVATTEGIVNITLDSERNDLIVLELKLTILSAASSTGALFSTLFGMNLLSGLEESASAFWQVSYFSVGVAATVGLYNAIRMSKLIRSRKD